MGPEVQALRLIRDRDGIYDRAFDERVDGRGLKTLRIAPRSPWQNVYAERFIGTLRLELLERVIVLGERHLLRLVREYALYFKAGRPHVARWATHRSADPLSRPQSDELWRYRASEGFTIDTREQRECVE